MGSIHKSSEFLLKMSASSSESVSELSGGGAIVEVQEVIVHRVERPIPLPRTKLPNHSDEASVKSMKSAKSAMSAVKAAASTLSSQSGGECSAKTSNRSSSSLSSLRKIATNLPIYAEVQEKCEKSKTTRTRRHTSNSSTSAHTSKSVDATETETATDTETEEEPVRERPYRTRQPKIESIKMQALKKKKRRRARVTEEAVSESSVTASGRYEYEQIIGIVLHESTDMVAKKVIVSPRVRVSWHHISAGGLLKKTDATRNVINSDEPDYIDFIQPVISGASNVNMTTQRLCRWEEVIVINEDASYLQRGNEIVFFELIDIAESAPGGWHHICWAFLVPRPAKRFSNVNQRCRLQLYKYKKYSKSLSLDTVYGQWKNSLREKYLGTLDVTIKEMTAFTSPVSPVLRSYHALQPEKQGTIELSDDEPQMLPAATAATATPSEYNILTDFTALRSKFNRPNFRCPQHLRGKIAIPAQGCLIAKFNASGRLAAFSEADAKTGEFNIRIVQMPELRAVATLRAHSNLIYDIDWRNYASPGQSLVSASSDRMAIVWHVDPSHRYTQKMLPHPSFVYCAKFVGDKAVAAAVVATAGRDSIVRIWRDGALRDTFDLVQELAGHSTFVTTLERCATGSHRFYSGDNGGTIIEWNSVPETGHYAATRKIVTTLRGAVDSLQVHPLGVKMYVSGCAGGIKVLELQSGTAVQTFGVSSELNPLKITMSPCRSWIFQTTDAGVQVWCTKNGTADTLIRLPTTRATFVSSVDCHPRDSLALATIYSRSSGGGGVYLLAPRPDANPGTENAAGDKSKPAFASPQQCGTQMRGKFVAIIRKIDEALSLAGADTVSASVESAVHADSNDTHRTFSVASQSEAASETSESGGGGATYNVPAPPRNDSTFTVRQDDCHHSDDTTVSESL